jgi:hypothetical protein
LIAEEYANLNRINGEGPGLILQIINESYDYIILHKPDLKDELNDLLFQFGFRTKMGKIKN